MNRRLYRVKPWPILFSTLLLWAVSPTSAQMTVFDRWKPSENMVTFESRAPAELLIGRTRSVGGVLRIVDHVIATASGEVTVQTSAFQSGVALRDETIRSPDWLNAQAFPVARLTINQIIADPSVLGVSKTVDVVARGTIEIRGATQNITLAATLCYMPPYLLGDPDARLRIHGEFVINIEEFGMKIPLRYTARINPEIVISFRLLARGSIISSLPEKKQPVLPPPIPPQEEGRKAG